MVLTGCGNNTKTITVTTKPADVPDKVVQDPDIFSLRQVKWYILTDQNYSEVFKTITQNGNLPVVFALTVKDYENLALNMKDIMIFIMQQNEIVKTFKTKKKEQTNMPED